MRLFRLSLLAATAIAALGAALPAAAQSGDGSGALCPAALDVEAYPSRTSALIVTGRDGWLFRTNSDLRTDFSLDRSTQHLLERLVGMLKERGTTLGMLLIPTRGMVEFDQFDPQSPQFKDFDPRLAIRNFARFLDEVKATGAIVPNILGYALSSTLDEPFFELHDHHWSVAGSRISAFALADTLSKQEGWADLPKAEYESAATEDSFILNESFAGLMTDICGVEYPERRIPIWRTTAKGSVVDANALFGDVAAAPVVLAGTSMTNKNSTDDFNFGGFFSEFSGVALENEGVDGGGPDEALLAYLRSSAFHEAPPPFLIWEMPGYYDINQESTLREAIADVAGSCADAPVASVERDAAGGEAPLFDALPDDLSPADAYVEIALSDTKVRRVALTFTYGGRKDKIRISRSGRARMDGLFALAADDAQTAPIDGLTIQLPDDVEGTLTARLCRFGA